MMVSDALEIIVIDINDWRRTKLMCVVAPLPGQTNDHRAKAE